MINIYLNQIKELYLKSRDFIIIILIFLIFYLVADTTSSKEAIRLNDKKIKELNDNIDDRNKVIDSLDTEIFKIKKENDSLLSDIEEITNDRNNNRDEKNGKIILVDKYSILEQQQFFTTRYKSKK